MPAATQNMEMRATSNLPKVSVASGPKKVVPRIASAPHARAHARTHTRKDLAWLQKVVVWHRDWRAVSAPLSSACPMIAESLR